MMSSGRRPSDYVECPICSVQVPIDPVRFTDGRSNGHAFNAFAVYRDSFQRIPLATGIGQKLSDAVYRSYRVRGTGEDSAAIDDFLNAQNFMVAIHDIVLDTIVYGNSIVDVLNAGPQMLQRIDFNTSDWRRCDSVDNRIAGKHSREWLHPLHA